MTNARWLKIYPPESIVIKAYNFTKEAHQNTKRESGEPYITHSLAVAQTVHEWGFDELSVAAALLHDVVEDEYYSHTDIEQKFGEEIAFLVDGLTKLKSIEYPKSPTDLQTENFRKFVIACSKDLRVVLIKLADRFHNMKTLGVLPPARQKKIAWETMEIYAPLAYRLGMQKLSGELEDITFSYLYPDEYRWLMENVRERYEEREVYAARVKPIIEKKLKEHNINPVVVDSRAKRYYSLYKKLQRYDMNLENIYDLVALRIILKTVEECYIVLGIIHQEWSPVPGRFKDYIARPKPNGYQSLHTTVFCLDNKITEIQIRTQEMHQENELGIAAHWTYSQLKHDKEYFKKWRSMTNRKELQWVEQLREWQKHFSGSEEYLQSLKVDFFKERIFILTPKNEVIDLPAGATPIDFAYRIHGEIGDQCVGAKVNGKIAPLDYELRSGDVVEILTQKGKKPSGEWLRFIKTSIAKSRIQRVLREKDRKLKKQTEQPRLELKIINQDRPGYLKNITNIFGKMKINILYLNSAADPRGALSTLTIRCDVLDKTKFEKLLVRLKGITATKEIRYKFNR
jgi:GTP pyrophosphokinase